MSSTLSPFVTPPLVARAYACRIEGAPALGETTCHATSAGKAKAEYFRRVREAWPTIRFSDVRVRVTGPVSTSESFQRVARLRGLPELRCGQRVRVGSAHGTVVGHNASANFEVLFDPDTRHAGLTLNVHPGDLVLLAA